MTAKPKVFVHAQKTAGRKERSDWDFDPSFFDTKTFKAKCLQVLAVMSFDEPITIRGIRDALGENFDPNHIQDILESLTGSGLIRREWGALPSKYTRCVPKPKVTIRWEGTPI